MHQADRDEDPGDEADPPAVDAGVLLGDRSEEEHDEDREDGEADQRDGAGRALERRLAAPDQHHRPDQSDHDQPPDNPDEGRVAAADVGVVEPEDRGACRCRRTTGP